VALCGALSRAAGRELPLPQLNERAHALERLIHGTPSGVDDTVITHRRPLWLPRRGAAPELLDPPGNLELLLASSGAPGSTREAVAGVRELARRDEPRFSRLLARARELALLGREAFLAGDAWRLGRLMSENHGLLQQVGVSTGVLDRLVSAARQAGALGAKLTGGGRGGFVVLLAAPADLDELTTVLQRAGAAQVVRAHV
jgi:mevalonate kinase